MKRRRNKGLARSGLAATLPAAARSSAVNRLFLILCASLAACSGDAPAGPVDEAEAERLAGRIEALAVLNEAETQPPPRLGTLAAGDIPPEYRGPACRLQQGETLLLLAAAPGALARVDGRVVRLSVAGPAGPSGGFFKAQGVTVSVGRRVGGSEADGASLAGATVGGDPKRPIERLTGRWSCIR